MRTRKTTKNKKAEMGMGTLIIFIALILVAAVAASVLIQTTGSLQNKALATGKGVTQEVGTSLATIEIYGENGTNSTIDELAWVIKLNAGSDPIRFDDVLMRLNTNNDSGDFTYDSTINCSNISSTIPGGDFGLEYSIQGNNFKSGYLNRGDVVKVCFENARLIIEDESLTFSLIPKTGNPLTVATSSPSLMTTKRVQLFP